MTKKSNQRLTAFAIVMILALLAANAYLLFTKVEQEKLIQKQNSELIEGKNLYVELEKEYYESLRDLEEMKDSNKDLNQLIDNQKEDLRIQKNRIAGLIEDAKASKNNYEVARDEIRKLREQTNQYLAQIASLQRKNSDLKNVNQTLNEDKRILEGVVENVQSQNEQLTAVKTSLTEKNVGLENEKQALEKKVDIASMIRVHNISGYGYKITNAGKMNEKQKAKYVDGISVCYNILPNDLITESNEEFFVRIVNPMGETIAIEDEGSGVLTENRSNEKVRYTISQNVAYEQKEVNKCVRWAPDQASFAPGVYKLEVYNKGYLAGTGDFVLK